MDDGYSHSQLPLFRLPLPRSSRLGKYKATPILCNVVAPQPNETRNLVICRMEGDGLTTALSSRESWAKYRVMGCFNRTVLSPPPLSPISVQTQADSPALAVPAVVVVIGIGRRSDCVPFHMLWLLLLWWWWWCGGGGGKGSLLPT